jgi:hypothetical protein
MHDPPEVRIIVRYRKDRRAEMSIFDPKTHKEVRTGLKVGPGQEAIEAEIYKLKRTLERKGNRVTVKELD